MLTRKRLCVGVALLAGVCLAACGGAQSRYQSYMKRGQEYFAQGDFTKASIEFRNALQIEPKSDAARLAVGHAAEKLQRVRDAYGLYQAVVDASPDNLEAREDLARLLVVTRSPDQALKTLEPGFAKHPDDPVLLTLRAAARAQLNNRTAAVADADRALQLAPLNEEAIQVRTGLYKQAGDIAGARALVENAVHKLPKSMALREILADLDQAGNDPVAAEQQLAELIKLSPSELRFRFQLAIVYSRNHQLDEAQRVLEDTVKAQSGSDTAKSNQAKLALVDFMSAQRSPAQADKTLRDFIAHDPDNYDLRLALGALQRRSGSIKDAIGTYNEIVSRAGTEPNGLTARDRLADIAMAEGREADARKLLEEVLTKNSHDNEALGQRALLELAHSDPAAAIGDLRVVLRDHPQSVAVQRMLARAYSANGQPGLAEQSLRAALDVTPADAALRVDLAQLLLGTQRVDEAVTMLEDVVRRAPTDAAARTALIRAYLAKQNFDAARGAAMDLETLRPESGEGPYYAGLAAVGQNKLDEAQKEFEHSLKLQPRGFSTLTAFSRLLLARGQAPQAIALIKDASAKDPSNPEILNQLGELYLGQKDLPHATETLNRVIALAPKWWVPYRNLAAVRLEAKDAPGAIAQYQAGLKTSPDQPQMLGELGLLYENTGRVDDAIALYDAACRRNPHVVIFANNLAMLLVTYKKDRPSLDRARDLTTDFASSTDGKLLDTNGWVHFKRGEYADALPLLGRAADRAPNSKEIRYHLGMAELHAGQTDRARSDLETAVSGSARFLGADEARTTLASLKGSSG